jgi:serine/threonine protein kinase/class 3 adenylate cyclase
MAATELPRADRSRPDAHASVSSTRAAAGLVAERWLSRGPDGSAVLARDPLEQTQAELRFVTPVRSDPVRWQALAQRCALLERLTTAGVRAMVLSDLDGDDPLVAIAPAPGPTLGEWLRASGPLEPHTAARVLERLAFALGAAHRLSLVHGALGPDTVWMDDEGAPHVELTGLSVTSEPEGGWALACVAPEARLRARWELEPSADLYALGVLGLGLLVGGDPMSDAARVTTGGVVEGLRQLLAQVMTRDPDERPSAAEWTLTVREWREVQLRSTSAPSDTLSEGGARGASSGAMVTEGSQLGRYYLVRKLGEGGMGEVWEGMDLTTSASVAVKLLRPEVANDAVFLRRFRKEARTLAAVRSPYTANLVEINEDRGLHYLVMEYVEGRSVGSVLDARGAFDERDALAIIADACRALVEPHRVGVVHRDLKPDNLMFVRKDEPVAGGDEGRQRVKVCDFGIARQQEGNADATQMTQEGMLLGTPAYMSPEQCRGVAKVGPTTDVYSLGATLFELLTGRLPFEAETPMGIVVKHLSEPAPSVRALRDALSEATAAIVAKALAKDPVERYPDAKGLLDAIESVLVGAGAVSEAHPALPPSTRFTRRFVFEWDLASSPELLWPYVSNTEKINRAVGMAPVKYLQRGVVKGVSDRFAKSAAFGMKLEWQEQPFEWIEGRKHSVLRTFERGALRWYCAETSLERLPNGGTRLRNTMTITARGWLGYLATPIQIGVQFKRAADRMFRRLDALLSRADALSASVDPMQPEVKLSATADATLARATRTLIDRGVSAEVAEGLAHYLRVASDLDVSRIRPLALATRLKLPPEQVANACLYLASEGTLALLWDVLCPSCQIPSSVAESLDKVAAHGSCATCNIDFELDFARSVELVFRPARSVREVETGTFCVGGPGHFPHVVAQLRVAPGERFDLSLGLAEGTYRVRSAQLPSAFELRVRKEATRRRADLHFTQGATRDPRPIELSDGEQLLALSSGLDRELLLRVERGRDESLALTAAKASAMRAFRELFGDQVLAPGALVSVASMTLLSTVVHDAAALFRSLGDGPALAMVLEHFRVISDVAGAHGGALLKTVGTQAIAAFDQPSSAVEAALALREALRARPSVARLSLQATVHQGPMIAATVGDRLDYFGHHAELALAIPHELSEPVTLLTQPVADDAGVRALLRARALSGTPRRIRSQGLDAWGLVLREPNSNATEQR